MGKIHPQNTDPAERDVIYPVHYLEIVLADVIGGYGYGGREGEREGTPDKT